MRNPESKTRSLLASLVRDDRLFASPFGMTTHKSRVCSVIPRPVPWPIAQHPRRGGISGLRNPESKTRSLLASLARDDRKKSVISRPVSWPIALAQHPERSGGSIPGGEGFGYSCHSEGAARSRSIPGGKESCLWGSPDSKARSSPSREAIRQKSGIAPFYPRGQGCFPSRGQCCRN